MPNFNYETKRIIVKVVYYGPGLGGKKTSLEYIHAQAAPERRGIINLLRAEADHIMYFNVLSPHTSEIKQFKLSFQLCTVPGQVKSNNPRRTVLEGVDAIVFVADSQRSCQKANLVSFGNLKENLRSYSLQLNDLPLVFSYNKRDLRDILSVTELNRALNPNDRCPYVATIATKGKGVLKTFEIVSNLIIRDLTDHLQDFLTDESNEEAGILELPGLEESLDFDIDQELTLISEEEEEEKPFSYLDIPAETYHDGDLIFEEGEPGDKMFFIESGKVRIVASYKLTKKILVVLERGDFFGEMALLGGKTRSASAVAIGTTNLLPIDRDTLASQIHNRPEFAMSFLETLSHRIETSNETVGKLLDHNKGLKEQLKKAQNVVKHVKEHHDVLSQQLHNVKRVVEENKVFKERLQTFEQIMRQNKVLTQSLKAVNRVAEQNRELQQSLKRAQQTIKNLMEQNKKLKKKTRELNITIVRKK